MNDLLRRGPEILPGTWEYEWVASVVAKAAEYAGRDSHWNGKLYEQDGDISGIYHTDGSMTISRKHVLDPARAVYAAEQTPTRDERWAASSATEMAVFQARLSLSEFGDESAPGATPNGSWEDLALERGLADEFTQRYVGRISEDLTEHSLPHGHMSAFPAYTAATGRLMYPLAGATGLGVNQLRDLVESTERTQRFAAIADRAIDHQVGDLVPDAHRAQLREHLTGPLRRGLGGLAMTEHSRLTDPGVKSRWGDSSAEWTALEFETNLDTIKDHYESWNAEHPGVEPPELPDSALETFRDREDEVRQIWAEAGWPAQRPVAGREQAYYQQLPEQLYPNEREQEIARLQQFLWSHTAPSRHTAAQTESGDRPDNVRSIKSAKRPDRGVE
ncbi:hypothetical protein [Kribbella sp. NPDC050459]|uniref:hypothetical protein n=1 Tax=Kribbella sp. NPDC050459 TaxID=3155785 RepID=UPI0033E67966